MKTASKILVFLALTSAISDARQIQKVCRGDLASEANRRFAYDLYQKVAQGTNDESNIFLAPATVSAVLGMILLGANGTTKERLWEGLKFRNTSEAFTEDDYPCLLPRYKIKDEVMAMRSVEKLWGEKTFDFDEEFMTKMSSLGAPMENVDFAHKPQEAREHINSWVSNATENKVRHIFSEDDITSSTVLAATSAIYFKGLWKTSFSNRTTKPKPFNVGNKTINISYMKTTGRFKTDYSRDLRAKLLELPYKPHDIEHEISMIIVLPDSDSSINETEVTISEKNLTPLIDHLLHKAPRRKLKVLMPKFKIRGNYNLQPMLTEMGMGDMFSPETADFSAMRNQSSKDNRNLSVGSVVLKTFLQVNEKGTEAAGAAAVSILGRSRGPIPFHCSRPFMILIYDKLEGRILFIGRVIDPTKK